MNAGGDRDELLLLRQTRAIGTGEPGGILTVRGGGVVSGVLAVFIEAAGKAVITKAPQRQRSVGRIISPGSPAWDWLCVVC